MKGIHHSQYLSSDGLGGGTSQWIGDYTVPVVGYVAAPTGQTFAVTRVLIGIGDSAGMQANEYGNLGSVLDPGIEIKVTTLAGATEISDLTAGKPILTNSGWGSQCYDVDLKSWGSSPTDQLLVARYTFEKHGAPIYLKNDDRIQITFAEDFTGLLTHTFLFEGMLST